MERIGQKVERGVELQVLHPRSGWEYGIWTSILSLAYSPKCLEKLSEKGHEQRSEWELG